MTTPERILPRVMRLWAPVVLWMLVIFLLSSIPGNNIPRVGLLNADKIVHFSEYFILGVLLIRAMSNSFHGIPLISLVILSVVVACSYGAADEWHQHFVSGRVTDIFDLVADISGAFVSFLFYINKKKGPNTCHH